LERKEHTATLFESKRHGAVKIALGATRSDALHVIDLSELSAKDSARARLKMFCKDVKNAAFQWLEEPSD